MAGDSAPFRGELTTSHLFRVHERLTLWRVNDVSFHPVVTLLLEKLLSLWMGRPYNANERAGVAIVRGSVHLALG